MNLRYAVYTATAVLALSTGATRATTYNFNFSVNTSDLVNTVTVNSFGTTKYTSPLTNVATGSPQIPGYTLFNGDSVSGSISFSEPFTIPYTKDGDEIEIFLTGGMPSDFIPYGFYGTEVMTFYDNGSQVFFGGGFSAFNGGSGGGLTVAGDTPDGGFATDPSQDTPAPSLTFDTIDFDFAFSRLTDNLDNTISSANIPSSSPILAISSFGVEAPPPPPPPPPIQPPTAVPEPSSIALLVSGLLGLMCVCLRIRRGKRASDVLPERWEPRTVGI